MQKRGILVFGILAIILLGVSSVPAAAAALGFESDMYKAAEAKGEYSKENLIAMGEAITHGWIDGAHRTADENGYTLETYINNARSMCTHERGTVCPSSFEFTGESCPAYLDAKLQEGLDSCDYVTVINAAKAAYLESLNSGSTPSASTAVAPAETTNGLQEIINPQVSAGSVPDTKTTDASVTPEISSSNVGFFQGISNAFSQLIAIVRGLFGF